MDLGAECAEGARVFSADHTRPDDRQNLGNAVQLQDRIGIVNFAVTERKNVGMNRRGTGSDEELFTAQLGLPAEGGRILFSIFGTSADLDRMRVEEGAGPVISRRLEHLQPLRDTRAKSILHVLFVAKKIGDGHFPA